MVVRRSVRKALTAGSVTAQVNINSNSDGVKSKNEKDKNGNTEDVVLRSEKNKLNNKEYTSARRDKSSSTNRRGWFSPEEISASPDLSSSCNEVFISDKKNGDDDKEEYDSAYDTLMTNKSSRSSHQADVSSDVESTSTERTLAPEEDAGRRKSQTPIQLRQQQQRGSMKESNTSSEKRRSTFFIIPESGSGGSVDDDGNKMTSKFLQDEYNDTTPGVPDDDFDYEYEVG